MEIDIVEIEIELFLLDFLAEKLFSKSDLIKFRRGKFFVEQ